MTYTLEPPLPETPTPRDYERIHFNPAELPRKRIVGLLACQRDPLLQALTTRVVSVAPAAAPPLAQKGRAKKKDKGSAASSATGTGANTPAEQGKLWEVELEDTVIFPEGGGQPWDTGTLYVTEAGETHALVIEGCVRRKLDAVHMVRVPPGTRVDPTALPGTDVRVEAHWERRMDHMTIHTAQHLLSAVLDARELPTLSWGMPAWPATDAPYVELPRGLTWAEAADVEDECNRRIREARRVWIDFSMQGGASGASGAGGGESDDRENRGIPKDYTGGVIRHCNIDGIDRNACCGTQCPDLSLVGFIHVLPPSTPHAACAPSSRVPTRLFFVAGPRAVSHLALASRWLSQAGQAIGVSRAELVPRIEKIEAIRFETDAAAKSLKAELAGIVGAAAGKRGVVWIPRVEKSTHDYEFMTSAAGAWGAAGAEEGAVIVFTSAPPGVSPTLLMVQGKDEAQSKSVFEGIKNALDDVDSEGGKRVKGGGARGRFMAKVDGKWGKREIAAVQGVIDNFGQASRQ
ncbi:ThrRS/AlaRS common domain-containing protein [Cutaneotrichosporon oleaginosum]|uniref:ThrRS/AlaRS common domain-containing protein n=1 Tax=Cutaneotrichosporon oleaginosum TaxID=879819 RepID=A0A0J0XR54_9TREE|nr:ThrRS/AlaRS common domain-containing protein [Cutaneotrichosporon oleaginosum]KLT43606.1 ThrRS/AlaRS common domain-containing protein [Cutaneotrichosporon oleaginosum]TXT12726.1 hypothetical protein COLE_03136 [Cutaneotrichosporon oleaginosum]